MKRRNSFYALMMGFLLTGAFTECTFADGTTKTEDRAVSGFHQLEISGSFAVEISQGSQESLKIEADEDMITHVITEVKDGTLRIFTKGKSGHVKTLKVYLTFKNLDGISSSGSLVMTGKGTMKFDKLDLDLSGSADIDLQVEADLIHTDMSGSSDIGLSGNVTKMTVAISGAGNLEASDLMVQTFDIEISGSGDANINVARELDVEISGSGAVVYKGNPNIKKSISGSGSIKKSS